MGTRFPPQLGNDGLQDALPQSLQRFHGWDRRLGQEEKQLKEGID